MLHSNDRIVKHKVGLLNLAQELGNISQACKLMGVYRDTFYRYREAAEEGLILTDRGTEYCGKAETHDYQLYLAINDIEHTRTKSRHPQTNGICERFHKTVLQEFYQPTLRKKLYGSVEELQQDLDEWLEYYNNERTHQGKMCCGRTPMETLRDGKQIWQEKFIN